MRWFRMGGLLGAFLSAQNLQVGDAVPATLTAKDENEKAIRLSDFKGQWLVLYFYPHDDTPGCTKQAKEFSRLLEDFQKLGAQVYGMSLQGADSHRRFRQKYQLKVPLLTDEKGQVAQAFGVKTFAGMCSRDVVVIDPQGKVALIRQGVSPENSPSEILAWLKNKKS
jgi:peroxiredoxin Q/BCP